MQIEEVALMLSNARGRVEIIHRMMMLLSKFAQHWIIGEEEDEQAVVQVTISKK